MSTPAVPVEHHPALLSATARLAEEFRGTYGPETIERLVHSADGRPTVLFLCSTRR